MVDIGWYWLILVDIVWYWLVLVDVLGRGWTRASGDERHVVRRQEVSEEERVYIIVAFVERRPWRFQFV